MNEEIKEILDKKLILNGNAYDCLEEKDKEIERLNNIINELEKLINEHELGKYDYSIPVFLLKEKLKELKESGKHE